MKPRLLGLFLLATSAAAEGVSLAELLPPETPVYFESAQPTAEEQKSMAIYRCFEEPAFRAAMQGISRSDGSIASTEMPLGPARLRFGVDLASPSLALQIVYADAQGERRVRVQNRMAAAVVAMREGAVPVDAVVAFEVDTDPRDALETILRIVAAGSLARRGELLGDVDAEAKRLFRSFELGGTRGVSVTLGRVTLFAAPLGSMLVLATDEARLRDMEARLASPGSSPSLATSPGHRRAIATAPGSGSCTFLLEASVPRALDALAVRQPQPANFARTMLRSAGLGSLDALAIVSRADGTGVGSSTSLLFEGERKGLASLFEPSTPGTFPGLAFAPRDTIYVTAGRADPGRLWRVIRESVGMPALYAEGVARQAAGIDLAADLLDHLGPEGALIVASNRGLIPDIGIVLDVRDAGKVRKSLEAILGAVPWPDGARPLAQRIAGIDAVVAPFGGSPALGNIPIAPTFGFVEGKLLLTPFPISFQRFVAVRRGESPSIAGNRDFASLRERVPAGALAISYLDLPRVFGFYYDTFMPILQGFPNPTGATGIYDLPDAGAFLKHLYGRIGWRIADEQGCHWRSHGPVELNSFIVAAMVGASATLFAGVPPTKPPSSVAVEIEGPRDREANSCTSRVRLIRARLLVQRQSQGSLPESLDALRAPHVPEETFLVPGTDLPYTYLGPSGRGRVLLHGAPNGRDRVITVLTTGFEVKRVSAEELEAMLR